MKGFWAFGETAVHRFLEATVADYMTGAAKSVNRTMTLDQLSARFDAEDYNAYPVVEGEEVVGLVTKFDFLKVFILKPTRMVPHYDELMSHTVDDVMTSDFIYVTPATKLTRALQLMVEHRIRSVPVIASMRQLVGMISRGDVMRALHDSTRSRD
jgi:CBS domain-containing protein